jgi:hypothetical protein
VVAKSSKRPYAVCGRMAINVGRNSKSRFYQEMVNSLIIEKGKIKEYALHLVLK